MSNSLAQATGNFFAKRKNNHSMNKTVSRKVILA